MIPLYTGETELQPLPETLVVLDIDRTLIRTTELFHHMKETLCAHYNLPTELMSEMEQAEHAERHNAFDFLGWLSERIGAAELQDAQALTEMMVAGFRDDNGHMSDEFSHRIMIDDVDDLLEAIHAINGSALLMTAGGTVQQEVKVRLIQYYVDEKNNERDMAGLAPLAPVADFMVVDNSKQRKAELLNEAFTSGRFSEDSLLAHASMHGSIDGALFVNIRHAIVIDDKPRNVANAGEYVEGWLAQKDGDAQKPGQSLHELAQRMRGY